VYGEIPGREAGEFAWLEFEQAGVLTRQQAVATLGRADVERHLKHRRWRPIFRDLYVTHNGPLHPEQQLWVAVLVAGEGALLAGRTAATAAGVTGLRDHPLQLLVPAPRLPSRNLSRLPSDIAPVRVYRTAVLPDHHVQIGRPSRTTLDRSIVDAAAWAAGDNEARSSIARACQQQRVTPDELRAVLDLFPRVKRHRLISATLSDIAGGATSLAEIDFVALCHRFGLPEPTLQKRRRDASGRNRYLDAYWPEHHLCVEVDGAQHIDAEHWSADMLRQNDIWIKGDRILRYPAWLIRTRPAEVAAQLAKALTPPRSC
jgi:hypothetical protein